MKCSLVLPAFIVLGFVSCDTMNQPITSGDFDPLRPPGSNLPTRPAMGPTFRAGQFVRATIDNTAFFKNRPKGDADADKLLRRGTSMKVISTSDTFLKVELDTGEVGFVPAIMVEDPNAAPDYSGVNPGEYQVYPPIGTYGDPLPPLDPTGLPPDGAIPTVIDPEAPSIITPIDPVDMPTDTFPTPPVEPNPAPAPLPPNDDDLKAADPPVEAPAETPAPKLE
jgi:hypothetical protein